MLGQVRQRVEPVVAAPVGKQERPLVRHGHEPRLAAPRGRIEPALGARGRHDDEGRQLDEPAAVAVEVVELLSQRALLRRSVEGAQAGFGGDGGHAAIVPVTLPQSAGRARGQTPHAGATELSRAAFGV
jgi:hypothetical protein